MDLPAPLSFVSVGPFSTRLGLFIFSFSRPRRLDGTLELRSELSVSPSAALGHEFWKDKEGGK